MRIVWHTPAHRPVQGTNQVPVLDICDRFGIVMIADGVMCGFSRTGKWFALEYSMLFPIWLLSQKVSTLATFHAAAMQSTPRSRLLSETGRAWGLTYSGHPLVIAAAVSTINAIADEKIVENSALVGGQVIAAGFRRLQSKHKSLGEVRGVSVFRARVPIANRVSKDGSARYRLGDRNRWPRRQFHGSCRASELSGTATRTLQELTPELFRTRVSGPKDQRSPLRWSRFEYSKAAAWIQERFWIERRLETRLHL